MTPSALEAKVRAEVADDYRRRGYDVHVEPADAELPEFLRGFRPDIVARRADESVVVEIAVGTRTSVAERLGAIAARVNSQPGWRFSLVFASPDQPDQPIEARPVPLSVLERRWGNAEALRRGDQGEAAFLLLWSTVEGLLRLLSDRAQLPLTSLPTSALIRELYSAGEIDREQFETLMRLLPTRNQLVHGFGPQETVDVERLRSVVSALLDEIRKNESAQGGLP